MPEYGGEGPLPFSTSDKVTESYIGVSIGLINRTPLERATENIPNHLHRGIVSYYSFVIGFVVTTTSLMAGALGLNWSVATMAFLMARALGLNRFVATTAFLMTGALGLNRFVATTAF